MGETRKKCNSDDRRLRRIQGGAVGAAVSRTRVPLKARSGRWAPQPVLAQRLAFFRFDNPFGIIKMCIRDRPFAEEEAIVRQFLDENAGGWVIDGNYSKTCYARRLEEADKIIVLWFSPLVCLWRAVRRWQQNKGRVRESSAPGCKEKIDAEFVRWILHNGRTKQKWAQMERIGEKYPEKYVMIRNQRELDGFLKEL